MKYYKYPRTYHFDWSPNLQNDDRRLESIDGFVGKRVIVTEKCDGECTSMYTDCIHARSINSTHHPSREWVKSFWGSLKHEIPPFMRICGENMFATHSIHYTNLESYFLGFSVWINDVSLDWDTTTMWFDLLGITPVPIWYDGLYNEEKLHDIWEQYGGENVEGYVVRIAEEITLENFNKFIGKYVRKNHVQTDEFWMNKPVTPNELRKQ